MKLEFEDAFFKFTYYKEKEDESACSIGIMEIDFMQKNNEQLRILKSIDEKISINNGLSYYFIDLLVLTGDTPYDKKVRVAPSVKTLKNKL